MDTKLFMGCGLLLACVFLAGCTTPQQAQQPSFNEEQKLTESNQQSLIDSSPPPKLTYSLERENLIRRLTLLNDHDKVFYIYLVSYGKVMGFYVAKGKVSSVDSYLTNYQQIVKSEECLKYKYDGSGTSCWFAVEAPDLDGSYGSNGEGIFFFTTEGAYVEWRGEYLVSDFPLKLSAPVELTMVVNSSR
jgi:hypothetical protein